MARNLYISDLHFGHKNILHYDNRPFSTVKDMEDALIENWTMHVESCDTVHILGDFCWGNQSEWARILQQLKGHKVLIRGNHDPVKMSDQVARYLTCMGEYAEIDDAGRKVVLCHYPIVCFKNHFHGWYHLYGHVHNSFEANMMEHDKRMMQELYEKECRMFNVGCMMPWMDYTPRTRDQIIAWKSGGGDE